MIAPTASKRPQLGRQWLLAAILRTECGSACDAPVPSGHRRRHRSAADPLVTIDQHIPTDASTSPSTICPCAPPRQAYRRGGLIRRAPTRAVRCVGWSAFQPRKDEDNA